MPANKANSASNYFSLDAIYSFLNPSISPGGAGPPDSESLKEKPFKYIVKEVILDPKMNFVPWLNLDKKTATEANQTGTAQSNVPPPPPNLQQQGIHDYLKSYFETNKDKSDGQAAEKLKETIALSYQAIAGGGQVVENQNSRLDLGNLDYWGENCKSLGDIVPSLKDTKLPRNNDFTVLAFVSKDPYVSPSTRGTPQIDFFLNYTPPIVASQLIPHLDVEFQLIRSISGPEGERRAPNISSPSIVRFLMGSRNLNDPAIGELDAALELGNMHRIEGSNQFHNLSGMELFLMPQSLTNFGGGVDFGLEDLSNRLVKPKPFMPFASIEGVDITVQNAGAGKFATRKAVLKLKIHDKSRLSEMSEFLKVGGQGYAGAYVWITYGWRAPREDNANNEYFRFINQNMLQRDCYKVANTTFSFDARGQASVSIEMHSTAKKLAEEFYVKGDLGGDNLKNQLASLQRAMQTVQNIVGKYQGNPKFRVTENAQQVLNAASSGGTFADVKDANVSNVIDSMIKQMESGNVVSKDDLTSLQSSLNALKEGASGKGHVYTQALLSAGSSVKAKFQEMGKLPDPFLASDSRPPAASSKPSKGNGKKPSPQPAPPSSDRIKKYFNDDLAAEISKFQSGAAERNTKLAELSKSQKDNPIIAVPLEANSSVVSFGKLFLSFAIPAVRDAVGGKPCDELQIYFYSLNDSCGPLSGHSVAEFPVNITQFTQAYLEAMKDSGGETMRLEEFFSLLVNTQFVDQRAIGYGQNSFFKPWDPTKPNEAESVDKEKASDVELGMNNWLLKYGELKIPVIEMYTEMSTAGASSPSTSLIDTLRSNSSRYNKTQSPQVVGNEKLIMKIHIYDKQASPYKASQKILGAGDGTFQLGELDEGSIKQKLKELLKSVDDQKLKAVKEALNKSYEGATANDATSAKYKAALEAAGIDPESAKKIETTLFKGQTEKINAIRDRKALKNHLMSTVPTISIGANGTMIFSATAQSKTDGALGAMRVMNAMKGKSSPGVTMAADGLATVGGLPIFVSPMQLTMQMMGVPTAQLYQQFFIDFDTGLSIDNIYSVQQIQHTISPGKFTTQFTFAYLNGFAKFAAPQSNAAIMSGQLEDLVDKMIEALPPPPKQDKPKGTKKSP